MTKHRRQFTKEFKLHVIREVAAGKTLAQAAREHELHPNLIRKWQTLYAEHGQQAFAGHGKAYSDEAKIAELERLIGQLTIENAFLKRLLAHLEAKQVARK
ncbi:MAG: transposase [Acidobacteriaceae bacterium]